MVPKNDRVGGFVPSFFDVIWIARSHESRALALGLRLSYTTRMRAMLSVLADPLHVNAQCATNGPFRLMLTEAT